MNLAKLTAVVLVAAVSNGSAAGETTLAVASNFTAAMQSVAAAYRRESGSDLQLVFGSSGRFYAQIRSGAPFHAFFSADQVKPATLEKDGIAVPGSRFTYAIGALALWSRQERFARMDAATLAQRRFNKLALANPRLAPYGAAAVEVLQNLGLVAATREKWVQGENIAQTYQFVDTGNADLGFVALSQIIHEGRVLKGAAWIVPQDLYQPIRQDAVLLRHGEYDRTAIDFLHFVRGPEARRIIESYGYRNEPQP